MVRPRRTRRIFHQPGVTYFKPVGIPLIDLKEIVLTFDELEAIRLIDLNGLDQISAGRNMDISQSTLSRLLKTGRNKLADAIINGYAIKIEGGNFKISSLRGIHSNEFNTSKTFHNQINNKICKCPECGHEEPQIRGHPCRNTKCPECQSQMISK